MALTEDARAEISAAIAIVREDRFEAHARAVLDRSAPKAPDKDELIEEEETEDGKVKPPPQKIKPPEEEAPPAKKSLYWGEILSD